MDEQNVCDLILSKYDKLTKQTKTVADYILANQRETQYMSITTLADNCGVADATVYRLCRTLGFSGYNDFKLALVKGNGKRPLDMPLGLDGNVTMEDSIGDMSKKLYSVNASALADTLTRLDPRSIDKAVDTLKKPAVSTVWASAAAWSLPWRPSAGLPPSPTSSARFPTPICRPWPLPCPGRRT